MSRLGRRGTRVWSAAAYLLGTLIAAVVTVLALPLLANPSVRLLWTQWQRSRAGRLLDAPVEPHDVTVGRFLRWLPLHVATGVLLGMVAVLGVGNILVAVIVIPLWWVFPPADPVRLLIEIPVTSWGAALALGTVQIAVLGALAYWGFPPLAAVHARLSLAVLAPSEAEQLANRVEVLTRTRADVLNAHGAELRRIERDLHDGTQARLVAIAMRLAVARQALPEDPHVVAKLLREAHEGAEEAMTELRDVIRTIYPPILADRGLAGALRTVAARAGVPTQVDIETLPHVPVAVQVAAYFTVIEVLTNIAKHSRANRADLRVRRTGDRLSIVVRDDGTGGADETRGTGLAGIRRRAHALDGTVTLTSPAGGPTTIIVELPCG
jgi:signal transduction histidine kinase